MNAPDPTTVARLAGSAGLGRVRELVPLPGGANNRVFRLDAENGGAVLKAYFRHPDDPRDRLGAEWAFARLAWATGVRRVPEPLACDPEAGLAVFEHVAGERPGSGEGGEGFVEQAVSFVRDLNAHRLHPLAARLPVASEACFSLAEHRRAVALRVARLAEVDDTDAAEFVWRDLLPLWSRVRHAAEAEARDNRVSIHQVLDPVERCVSPSDFGLHNALVEPDGRLRFLDFEYAGWDDPAKLVCDFFCQPAVPVPSRYFDAFARGVAADFPDPPAVVGRAMLLLPVYRVKWVCIRLNEFLSAGGRRRAFSLDPDELEARRSRQLSAARTALRDLQEAA